MGVLGKRRTKSLCKIILVLTFFVIGSTSADYEVGIGIADVTGPVAEVPFMGYGKSKQKGTGLHLRQFARAFVIDDGSNRVAFVTIDASMTGHGLRKQVLQQLARRYGKTYNEKNFVLSASHTHCAPGGFMMYVLFDLTSYGFVDETFQAFVDGIVKAVVRAHKVVQPARILFNSGELLDANINRSPMAYLLNPQAERKRFPYNVDKEMTQMKFVSTRDQRLLGSIQWFPVHPTSMNNSNTLVSTDNVGYASILLEQQINKGKLIGKGPFISSFASSNLGDVSPNIRGPRCLNNGEPCEDVTSSCNGDAKLCVASGPGKDMFDSTKLIAERLYRKALELLQQPNSEEIHGPLRVGLQYVDMPTVVVNQTLENGSKVQIRGCLPAMGYSFAAGTTDGPGEFDFKQGTVTDNTLWNTIRNFLATPTKADMACQHPKPILLNTGRIEFPYEWQPKIVPIQAVLLGKIALLAVPGEFTTMAGRRLRNTIKKVIANNEGPENSIPIICGLSNLYTDYITTYEEYQLQRYEAASTIFGPHTAELYMHLYSNLVEALLKETKIDRGPEPPDLSKNLISLIPPVLFDWAGWKEEFGDCIKQPPSKARPGDVVTVKFISGHPRNNVMHDKTFLTVERLISDDEWSIIATDANWETKFHWERTSFIKATSAVTVEWTIESNVEPGTYRIHHFGYYKYLFGGIFPYEGITNNFKVI